MKTILTLLALASITLALDPAVPFAAVAWTGAGATALSAALSGGKTTLPMQIAAGATLYGMTGVFASGTDAGLHTVASAGIYGASYAGLRLAMTDHRAASWWALGLTAAAGIAKEAYDSQRPGNKWDWNDMAFNALGTGLTWGVCEIVERVRTR